MRSPGAGRSWPGAAPSRIASRRSWNGPSFGSCRRTSAFSSHGWATPRPTITCWRTVSRPGSCARCSRNSSPLRETGTRKRHGATNCYVRPTPTAAASSTRPTTTSSPARWAWPTCCSAGGRGARRIRKSRSAWLRCCGSSARCPGRNACRCRSATRSRTRSFPLDPDEGWCSGSLRELRRALFEPAIAPAPVESAGWIRAFWLLGGELAPAPAEASPAPALEAFPDTGVHVFTDAARGARLVFRTAPRSGVPVAPGHMHADLLSVCLNVEGRPLLVDPGTYTYRSPAKRWDPGTPAWRTFFAGPAAHNGPVIADEDPLGRPAGDFRQTGGEARSEDVVRASDHLALVNARLTGAGVYEGAERTCIGVAGEYWLIIDHAPDPAGAVSRCHYGFQLAAGAAIECHERCASLRAPPDQQVTALAYGGGVDTPECLEGSLDPLDGWVSPAYGRLEPAPRLRFPVTDVSTADGVPSASPCG
ncbi:MAG: heparinase II/III-family protein [Halofilum sp. (in: g-proteobacteria)]|nr:heparinase II/III-family protein [Halofilum sp. (in: g-proteobacteria)]